MLSLSKLGIHFSVIFDDLPNSAIYERLKLINPDVIITKNISKIEFFKKYINKNKSLKGNLFIKNQLTIYIYYNFDKRKNKALIMITMKVIINYLLYLPLGLLEC